MSMDNDDEPVAPGSVGEPQHVDIVKYSRKDGRSNPRRPLFLLLHGWGSNEEDIADLMRYVAPYNDYASLRASMTVPGSERGMFGPGYTWFHRSLPQGEDLDRDGLAAATAVDEWVRANLSDEREVVTMGFSQGGMLAAHLLRINPERYRAAISLSGFLAPGLVPDSAPADNRLADMEKPVFHGYGTADQVVAPYEARAFDAWLDEHTWLRSRSYDGLDHAVSQAELSDIRQWLSDIDVTSGLM
ncbi:phospholipase/carboxylesterase [Bifidobacterium actinocoloniiforme DSM 22766]|uniref:Phospholipase/carboxylesterase n=1 Tax=Bifidobacterium actinocoloniiforme DSM 22766 TaxID=1437605 RepID=A0A086YWG8_9BIFI|nr:prolyl oligopeptidase family serine peptidase [Bifidobacterium actinocoloniiforme]AKV55812.1 esterase [Bifidobacterium actinocoloniiforme DSM 22766]KFI38618.1 phospholipase/carboxylesterase [Bifidobacterium actinocoloniiforme DSM 22766]